jgi:hypothetical protein
MTPLLNTVKTNAINFYDDLMSALAQKDKQVNDVRVRVIAFRDYLEYMNDGNEPMMTTGFYSLPKDKAEFSTDVKSIQPIGGGDEPEDGLEALAYAIKSKWNNNQNKKRHIIVLWSDAEPHDLGFGKASSKYPTTGMAKDFNELSQWWGVGNTSGTIMDSKAKRLLIYAPQKGAWRSIAEIWGNVLLYPSQAGNGLSQTTYSEILDAICGSV